MRRTPTSIAALFALAAALPAAAAPTIVCDDNDKNLKTYLQMHKILFTDRDGSRVNEFYAPEVKSHNNDAGGAGGMVKNESLAKMWAASKKNNPERVLEDELILCAGDFVVVRTTIHSTDNTGVDGNPPTKKSYSTTATDTYRFENGKVVERWGNADVINIYRQLGYVMAPAK